MCKHEIREQISKQFFPIPEPVRSTDVQYEKVLRMRRTATFLEPQVRTETGDQ